MCTIGQVFAAFVPSAASIINKQQWSCLDFFDGSSTLLPCKIGKWVIEQGSTHRALLLPYIVWLSRHRQTTKKVMPQSDKLFIQNIFLQPVLLIAETIATGVKRPPAWVRTTILHFIAHFQAMEKLPAKHWSNQKFVKSEHLHVLWNHYAGADGQDHITQEMIVAEMAETSRLLAVFASGAPGPSLSLMEAKETLNPALPLPAGRVSDSEGFRRLTLGEIIERLCGDCDVPRDGKLQHWWSLPAFVEVTPRQIFDITSWFATHMTIHKHLTPVYYTWRRCQRSRAAIASCKGPNLLSQTRFTWMELVFTPLRFIIETIDPDACRNHRIRKDILMQVITLFRDMETLNISPIVGGILPYSDVLLRLWNLCSPVKVCSYEEIQTELDTVEAVLAADHLTDDSPTPFSEEDTVSDSVPVSVRTTPTPTPTQLDPCTLDWVFCLHI